MDISHGERVEKELNLLIDRQDAHRRKDGREVAEALYLRACGATTLHTS